MSGCQFLKDSKQQKCTIKPKIAVLSSLSVSWPICTCGHYRRWRKRHVRQPSNTVRLDKVRGCGMQVGLRFQTAETKNWGLFWSQHVSNGFTDSVPVIFPRARAFDSEMFWTLFISLRWQGTWPPTKMELWLRSILKAHVCNEYAKVFYRHTTEEWTTILHKHWCFGFPSRSHPHNTRVSIRSIPRRYGLAQPSREKNHQPPNSLNL